MASSSSTGSGGGNKKSFVSKIMLGIKKKKGKDDESSNQLPDNMTQENQQQPQEILEQTTENQLEEETETEPPQENEPLFALGLSKWNKKNKKVYFRIGGDESILNDFDDIARQVITNSIKVAKDNNHIKVKPEHLMKALLNDRGEARKLFVRAGTSLNMFIQSTDQFIIDHPEVIGSSQDTEELMKRARKWKKKCHGDYISPRHIVLSFLKDLRYGKGLYEKSELTEKTLLDAIEGSKTREVPHCTDLTAMAANKKLYPIIGREDVISETLIILSKMKKANAVLVGQPGVGKSAIIEGIAQRIFEGSVSQNLQDCQLVSLDLQKLKAGGTQSFAKKMNDVMLEVTQSKGKIILFIDEIHTVLDAGVSELLKPVLARGDFRLIGATTLTEYRKYIDKDPALERRFEKVMVEPSTVEETISILQKYRPIYERFHSGIQISDDAIKAAVYYTDRYLTEHHLPDKAIDLLDATGAAISNREGVRLSQEVVMVTEEDVANTISNRTKIPISKLKKNEKQSLLAMPQELGNIVLGQGRAIEAVVDAIWKQRTGFSDKKRPIASLLFLGPTGVGKTQLAKSVSPYMYGSAGNFVTLDMSEYSERHSVSKLIGSPPGYVGYHDGGTLTETIRWKPYSVILCDEVEKAHADVRKLFLQILDEGRLTDSKGHEVNFKNTLVIMTSNIGSEHVLKFENSGELQDIDYEATKTAVMESVESVFPPEFVNRIDEFVVFEALRRETVHGIVKLQLDSVIRDAAENMDAKDIKIYYTDSAVEFLSNVGYNAKFRS